MISAIIGEGLSYSLQPARQPDLPAHHPGAGEKKTPCPWAPCPVLEPRGRSWGVSRAAAPSPVCQAPSLSQRLWSDSDGLCHCPWGHLWAAPEAAQPCIALSTEISAREREKTLGYGETSVFLHLLNELIAHITPTFACWKHKELLLCHRHDWRAHINMPLSYARVNLTWALKSAGFTCEFM